MPMSRFQAQPPHPIEYPNTFFQPRAPEEYGLTVDSRAISFYKPKSED